MIKENQKVLFRGKEIDAKHLSKGSHKKIWYICDICEDEFKREVREREKSYAILPYDTCNNCSHIKREETNMNRFGVKYPAQSEEMLNKQKKTMMERHGVSNPMESKYFVEKIAKTKMKNGTTSYSGEKFIVNGIFASRPQINISKKIDGKVNDYIFGKTADIVLHDEKVVIEYDGSGHTLSIKFGKKTEREFYSEELEYERRVLSNGWKFVRIKNEKDFSLDYDLIKKEIDNMIHEDNYYLMIDIS